MPPAQHPLPTAQLTQLLAQRGVLSSADMQAALGLSQPTVSRLLASLSDELVLIGRGRTTRYALAQPVGAHAAQHAVWMTDDTGAAQRLCTLSYLAQGHIHLAADDAEVLFQSTPQQPLPWLLSPLQAQGFLGRLLAQRLAAQGVPPNPAQWNTEATLLAALHTPDAPGALWLGAVQPKADVPTLPVFFDADPGDALDNVAQDVARTLPIGSSAGGEQPKFTAASDMGEAWLVKFSPPRGTPFGERWNDLLVAEAVCNQALGAFGHQVAQTRIIQTPHRTYLLSRRFDRLGLQGRRHVVSLGATHAGFVPTRYEGWTATADALVRQRRLAETDARLLRERMQFGHCVGNTDMHSGNASLWVAGHTLRDLAKGRFALAPVYDMLPMRWKPDPMWGVPDYQSFEVNAADAVGNARRAAVQFWHMLSADARISAGMRTLATAMQHTFPPS